jgi:hypothetical protein
MVASVFLPEPVQFIGAWRRVRDTLREAGISTRIDELVARLLDGD